MIWMFRAVREFIDQAHLVMPNTKDRETATDMRTFMNDVITSVFLPRVRSDFKSQLSDLLRCKF